MFGFVEKCMRMVSGKKRKALLVAVLVFAPLIVTVWGFSVNTGAGVTKYAVVVGISDYKAIDDLSYCDEDATDWFNHLNKTMSFSTVWVYGDGHVTNYPKYDGIATEYNVKQALKTWCK